MEIKASQVKELRDMTGVAMMDCKKALVECDGDIEKALDLLRSNSALKAEKKSSRVAADGILSTVIAENYATIIEINSETDFAAKDANFLSFVDKVSTYISENKVTNVDSLKDSELEDARKSLVQTIGENIQIRRVITSDFDNEMNVGLYLHSDSKLASAESKDQPLYSFSLISRISFSILMSSAGISIPTSEKRASTFDLPI